MKINFKLPQDKWLHFIIGMMLFLVSTAVFNYHTALIITVVVAFLKELNDGLKVIPYLLTNKGKTTFSLSDLIATIIVPLFIASILSMWNI